MPGWQCRRQPEPGTFSDRSVIIFCFVALVLVVMAMLVATSGPVHVEVGTIIVDTIVVAVAVGEHERG